MALPTVPQRTRKSGELTFFRYVRVGDKDKGAKVEYFQESTTTPGKMEVHVDDTYKYVAGGEVFIVGADDPLLNGYHKIAAVTPDGSPAKNKKDTKALTPGLIELETDWPASLSGQVTAPDGCVIYNVHDFDVTGQATDASGGSSANTDTWATLGVEDEEVSQSVDYDVNVSLFVDDNVVVAGVIGVDPTLPNVELNDAEDYHVHLLLETYSSRIPSQAILLYATVYEYVKWNSWDTPTSAGKNNYVQWNLSGTTKKKYIAKKR